MTKGRTPRVTGLPVIVFVIRRQCGARPTSLGGGRARLSAAAWDPRGGRESSRLAPSGGSGIGAGRAPLHACVVSVGKRRGVLGALAAASRSGRHAWRARDWVGEAARGAAAVSAHPSGWPGPRGSEGGGTAAAHWLPTSRPPSTGAAAAMIVLSGCTGRGLPARVPCDDSTEWMYWVRRTGLPAREPCRVRTLWVASEMCGGGVRRVRRPPALWSHRGAGARMPIPLGEESA